MSAIWGTITFQGTIPEHADDRMRSYYENNCKTDRIETLIHRNVYFGCGIQYITSEARLEKLPYYDKASGLYFTADCLLDNRAELWAALAGSEEINPSLPDGALMLLAYRKWGIDCVRHFRGLYSLALYDTKEHCVYLATDPTSSRCLYYYKDGAQLTFSTLLTPIRRLHPTLQTNEYYIKDFLIAPGLMPNISSVETPWTDVYKLNPGTYLKITKDSVAEISYWDPSHPLYDCHCRSAREYGLYFRSLFEDCVKNALRTDGNIGISLSSGLDSASVGALAANCLSTQKKPLYTYTYVPYEKTTPDRNRNNVHDETEDVQKIAAMHPNMITHFLNNHGKNCMEDLPCGVDIMEIPYKAYANLPSLCEVYREASDAGCKVVLTGQTGNSTVSCGYIDNILYDLYRRKKYVTFLSYLNHYCKTVKESRKKAIKSCIDYFRHANRLYADTDFTYQPDNPFLSETITAEYPLKERFLIHNIPTKHAPIPGDIYHTNLFLKSMFTYLGELDTKMGLAYGIVLRDPTRDMRMLSFCYHLPYHIFAYRGTPRWLIRGNLRDVLPEELLDNWMRYGVQNSDYYIRLMRDWHTLRPQLEANLNADTLKPYVDTGLIQEFFRKTTHNLPAEMESDALYLAMLNVLAQFFISTHSV